MPPTVTLYTKPGCHLCEPVAATIAAAGKVRTFVSVTRNILDNPAEFERYKHAIPVVTVDGAEVTRYRLTVVQLLEAIDRASAPNC
jgi:hypothetical protein